MSDSLGKKTSRQITELAFTGNSSELSALWHLSLILREVAESLASATKKEEPRAGDSLTSGGEGAPHE